MPEPTEATGDRIVATYDLHDTGRSPGAVAAAIALEQTVEVPQALADASGLPPGVVGEIERIDVGAGTAGAARARLSYDPSVVEAAGVPALINLVFGNVSMMPGVRLVDLVIPDRVLAVMPGPRHGVEGVRALIGVHGRPLLASALKPRGVPLSRLVEMAGAFARGGGDIIKDDQNLIDDFETFKDRVKRCADAVEDGNQRTGRRCLYLPHVTGPLPALSRRFEYVARLGLPGVLACPFIAGLGTARSLARDHDLVLMAHPAFSGGTSSRGARASTTACCSGRCSASRARTLRFSPTSGAGSSSPATTARTSRPVSALRSAGCRPPGRVPPAA